MANITTVIFDMYETLAHNSPELWHGIFETICRAQKLSVDPMELYHHWKTLEVNFRRDRLNLEEPEKSPSFKSYEQAWADCFQGTFQDLSLPGDAAAAARASVEGMSTREVYADAVEALPQIQARWRTAILSNADDDYLNPTLQRLGSRFEAVLSSQQAKAYKPHPAPFLQVMKMLGVQPQECVYVGDSQFDDVLGAGRASHVQPGV